MPLWDKVRQELDHAGKIAQHALDEGRLRLEAFRARQAADKAAQILGYALYRARRTGGDLTVDTWQSHATDLERKDAEAARLEAELAEVTAKRRAGRGSAAATKPPEAPPSDAAPPPPPGEATPPPAS